jgi:hypothetical protein
MTDNRYYISKNNRCYLVSLNRDEIADIDRKIEGRPDNYVGAFYRWLYELELGFLVEEIEGMEVDCDEDNDDTIGYNMPENWRHLLIDYLCGSPSIDDVEIFLGELGIRKAFRLADECGYYEEDDYKEALTTDDGLRRLFFVVLDALILTNDDLTEVEEDEYREHFPIEEDEDSEDDA